MATITFTDGTGAATVSNGKPAPANRFRSWNPDSPSVTAESESLATGQPYSFVFATRHTVTFTIDRLPQSEQADVLRLIAWLRAGGVCSVNTADASSRTYASSYLAKGTTPRFELSNPQMLEYSLTLTLVNAAGAAYLCQY